MQFVTICKPAAGGPGAAFHGSAPLGHYFQKRQRAGRTGYLQRFCAQYLTRRARGCIVTQSAQHFHLFSAVLKIMQRATGSNRG